MFRQKFISLLLLTGMLITQAVPRALAATFCDSAQFVSDLTVPDGSPFAQAMRGIRAGNMQFHPPVGVRRAKFGPGMEFARSVSHSCDDFPPPPQSGLLENDCNRQPVDGA